MPADPYDLALENYSLRIERSYGYPLVFNSGAHEDGAGWCESFYRGLAVDRATAASGVDEAKCMIMAQPIQRDLYKLKIHVA